jgi:hypothetical protein
MAFSDSIVDFRFGSAGEKCECVRSHSEHLGRRCDKSLIKEYRGRIGYGAWEAHHKDGNPENDSILNCEILCWDCRVLTF